MSTKRIKENQRAKQRAKRVRGKMHGTAERPRLTVFRSNQHTYLQAIDDDKGETVAAINSLMLKKDATKKAAGTKSERAQKLATEISKQLKKKKITKVVFDRGSYRYHGRLKTIADAVRAEGIEV